MTTPGTPAQETEQRASLPNDDLAPGLLSPRLALLAAVLYNPVVLIAYLLYLYGPATRCIAGPLCSFDEFPGIVQVPLLLASALLLWLLLYLFAQRAIEDPGPRQPLIYRVLAAISDFSGIRELLLIYSSGLAVALVVGIARNTMTLAAFILGCFTAVVCLYAALGAQPRDPNAPPPALLVQLRRLLPKRRPKAPTAVQHQLPPRPADASPAGAVGGWPEPPHGQAAGSPGREKQP